jgi:hypothetical protein
LQDFTDLVLAQILTLDLDTIATPTASNPRSKLCLIGNVDPQFELLLAAFSTWELPIAQLCSRGTPLRVSHGLVK